MTKKVVPAQSLGISNAMISHDAIYAIEKLKKHKFEGYIVGGGIRDLLLAKPPKDFDVVTNATPEQVRKIFKRNSIIIGKRFKIVHVIFDNMNPEKIINNRPVIERHIIEISTYRSSKVHKRNLNERGRITEDNNYGTQKEDAFRRDFTINSLYYDPIKELIIDYTDGLTDINNKLIRMIGNAEERYIEDPVRILRAVRLSIKLGLEIEQITLAPFNNVKQLLAHENKGRMYEEMLKILLCGSAIACIEKLKEIKLPKRVFPLFDKLFFTRKPEEFATNILKMTDSRLKETSDVSVIFILAGLMWEIIYQEWQQLLLTGLSPFEALNASILQNREYIYSIGIAKHTFSAIRDVWMLQLDFEAPNLKRLDSMPNVPRFRQAWHLFSARNTIGQVDSKLHDWWNRFISIENISERPILHDELALIIGNATLKATPSSKRSKRKKAITHIA
ncbi:MAG: polynucleotide adenylyltransferase PcnB [Burkholderiales bacterium]|nr:polynucleotide adenylyltransferase PcnB [Burkholderiales bacterium]